jgi:hypothetical protein
MANHPAIDRILRQINAEDMKEELMAPENSLGRIMEEEARAADERPEPLKDVSEVFSDEILEETKEGIDIAEGERKKKEEEAAKESREIMKKIEAGAELADFAPPETEETLGQNIPSDVKEYLDSEKEEYAFHSCFDLRDFFRDNRESFDEWAHPAVDSVLQAVDTITSGCRCKLKERRKMVEDYYVTFITQNQHNSLIGTMKEILKTKKIKFFSKEKLFLDI